MLIFIFFLIIITDIMSTNLKKILQETTNKMYGDTLHELYGIDSKIVIKVLDYSTQKKRHFVHATIHMSVINEETVSSSDLIDLFINDTWEYLSPDDKLDVIISVDVL